MATLRRSQDVTDLITSPATPDSLLAPLTRQNMRPRSPNSSRGSSCQSKSRTLSPTHGDDELLLRVGQEYNGDNDPSAPSGSDPHRRKRRRVELEDVDEVQQEVVDENSEVDQLDAEAYSLNEEPFPAPTPDIPESSTAQAISESSIPQPTYVTRLSTWDMPPDISFAEDQLPGNEPPLSNHTGEEHHVRLSPDPVTGQQAPTPWSPPIELSDEITIVSPIAHHISFSAPPTILNDQSLLSPPSPSRVPSTTSTTASTSTAVSLTSTSTSTPEPLSAYTCPICFSPPTNATLTPCGHICCGQCLFAAVKSTIRRNMVVAMDRAPPARCPVCRAEIPGWDGRGGGVVGLKMQVVYSL